MRICYAVVEDRKLVHLVDGSSTPWNLVGPRSRILIVTDCPNGCEVNFESIWPYVTGEVASQAKRAAACEPDRYDEF
jgi:hypothetical protein